VSIRVRGLHLVFKHNSAFPLQQRTIFPTILVRAFSPYCLGMETFAGMLFA
jgi:hypothetical protein